MPGWLQNFTDYNPLSALADAARGLMVGGPVAHDLWVTLAWSVGAHGGHGADRDPQVPYQEPDRCGRQRSGAGQSRAAASSGERPPPSAYAAA